MDELYSIRATGGAKQLEAGCWLFAHILFTSSASQAEQGGIPRKTSHGTQGERAQN